MIELPDIDSFNEIHPHFDDDPLSGSTTYSANSLLEEFADELALISYPPDYDDTHACDIESDIIEIEFLLYQGEDSDFKDSIDQSVLTHFDDLFVDPTPEMFIDEQPPDYSFPPRFNVYPDYFLEIESDATFDDDSFDSEVEKIKEAELLIDPLNLPCDILFEYDSFNSQDFSRDDVLFSPDNEDKVFNPGILSHDKSVKIITHFTQEKKLAVSFASWLFEDFDPLFSELLVFKEVPNFMRLLSLSSENEEKVFKPGIYNFKKFHCCFLSDLSHPGLKNRQSNFGAVAGDYSSLKKDRKKKGQNCNSPPLDVSKDTIEDLSESNEEFSSTDDDSYSFDKIDYYSDIHQPSKEISIDKLKIMMQSYCERINQQREQEALLAAQREQELLAQKQAAQEKEEPPQNSDFRQLIRERCGTKVCEEQKQNIEDTMLELLEDCRKKELYCMHNDVEDSIESAFNSKLFSINLKSQHLDKEKQEVKNIVEQAPKHRTCLMNDDKSLSNEDVPMENFKIYSNPLYEESISTKIDPHYYNAESNLIDSLLNQDTLIDSSPKFYYFLKEFFGELAHIDLIPPGIEETDFDLEEEIRLVENLLYANSSSRSPEELNAEIADTIIESLSPFPIPVEDSDSQMEEIDLFLATDDLMPPGIENEDYDSEGDIHFLE
nr:hypothetical protein [Tanacetum cinerariifolium]